MQAARSLGPNVALHPMKTFLRIITLSLLGLHQLKAGAGVVWDHVAISIESAGRDLASGRPRDEILARLTKAIEANPDSSYHDMASVLRQDLAFSVEKGNENPPQANGGFGLLMDTRLPYQVTAAFRWDAVDRAKSEAALEKFMTENPKDPMTRALRMERNVIGSLIPLLKDTSPTRSYPLPAPFRPSSAGPMAVPSIIRVCDMALFAIEFHSKCRFNYQAGQGHRFSGMKKDAREAEVRQIEEWWSDAKSKSVAEGIVLQLPRADFREKLLMAEILGQLAEPDAATNRNHAVGLLTGLVESEKTENSVEAARFLEKLGDLGPVEIFYKRVSDAAGKGEFPDDSSVVFYLTDHGGQREWSLLNRLAREEIDRGRQAGTPRVWPALVRCKKARTSPFAVPALAMGLTQDKPSGSRSWGSAPSQSYSSADIAAENLQTVTGADFGYNPKGSPEDRAAAIKKAREWWEKDGKAKYSY